MTKQRKTRRYIFSLILISVLILYLLISLYYQKHFYFGSYINNIDYSNQTVAKVEADISNKIKNYKLKIYGREDVSDTITASDIHYQYKSSGQIQALKKEQNPFLWPASIFNKKHWSMEVHCNYQKKALLKKIDTLRFFHKDIVKAPQNAKIFYDKDKYSIYPEELGTTLNKNIVITAIESALNSSKTTLSLEDENCYIPPTISSDDTILQNALKTAQTYVSTSITYDFGDRSEQLDKTILHDWISIDEDFDVTLNKQKVIDYVNYLGYHYTTFASTRDFIRHDGKTIQVRGGDYGFIINRSKEVEELYALIKSGETQIREPVYSQTAASRNKNDIGSTYIEIDLKKQKLWLFVNGTQIISSDIVTGNPNRNHATPTGVYGITYKDYDAILVGENYRSHVDYWMPFNGNIGLHDASWRKEFGKKIYEKNGSHGCINMPPKKAEKLFQNIEKGTPVIVY